MMFSDSLSYNQQTYSFDAPLHFGAPLQQKHIQSNILRHMPYMLPMCVRRQAPVSLAAAPRRELPKGTINMEPQAASPQ